MANEASSFHWLTEENKMALLCLINHYATIASPELPNAVAIADLTDGRYFRAMLALLKGHVELPLNYDTLPVMEAVAKWLRAFVDVDQDQPLRRFFDGIRLDDVVAGREEAVARFALVFLFVYFRAHNHLLSEVDEPEQDQCECVVALFHQFGFNGVDVSKEYTSADFIRIEYSTTASQFTSPVQWDSNAFIGSTPKVPSATNSHVVSNAERARDPLLSASQSLFTPPPPPKSSSAVYDDASSAYVTPFSQQRRVNNEDACGRLSARLLRIAQIKRQPEPSASVNASPSATASPAPSLGRVVKTLDSPQSELKGQLHSKQMAFANLKLENADMQERLEKYEKETPALLKRLEAAEQLAKKEKQRADVAALKLAEAEKLAGEEAAASKKLTGEMQQLKSKYDQVVVYKSLFDDVVTERDVKTQELEKLQKEKPGWHERERRLQQKAEAQIAQLQEDLQTASQGLEREASRVAELEKQARDLRDQCAFNEAQSTEFAAQKSRFLAQLEDAKTLKTEFEQFKSWSDEELKKKQTEQTALQSQIDSLVLQLQDDALKFQTLQTEFKATTGQLLERDQKNAQLAKDLSSANQSLASLKDDKAGLHLLHTVAQTEVETLRKLVDVEIEKRQAAEADAASFVRCSLNVICAVLVHKQLDASQFGDDPQLLAQRRDFVDTISLAQPNATLIDRGVALIGQLLDAGAAHSAGKHEALKKQLLDATKQNREFARSIQEISTHRSELTTRLNEFEAQFRDVHASALNSLLDAAEKLQPLLPPDFDWDAINAMLAKECLEEAPSAEKIVAVIAELASLCANENILAWKTRAVAADEGLARITQEYKDLEDLCDDNISSWRAEQETSNTRAQRIAELEASLRALKRNLADLRSQQVQLHDDLRTLCANNAQSFTSITEAVCIAAFGVFQDTETELSSAHRSKSDELNCKLVAEQTQHRIDVANLQRKLDAALSAKETLEATNSMLATDNAAKAVELREAQQKAAQLEIEVQALQLKLNEVSQQHTKVIKDQKKRFDSLIPVSPYVGVSSSLSCETLYSSTDSRFKPGLNCDDEDTVLTYRSLENNNAPAIFKVPTLQLENNSVKSHSTQSLDRSAGRYSAEKNDNVAAGSTKDPIPPTIKRCLSHEDSPSNSPDAERLREMNRRNKRQPVHLRSAYAIETQTVPREVKEDAIRSANDFKVPPALEKENKIKRPPPPGFNSKLVKQKFSQANNCSSLEDTFRPVDQSQFSAPSSSGKKPLHRQPSPMGQLFASVNRKIRRSISNGMPQPQFDESSLELDENAEKENNKKGGVAMFVGDDDEETLKQKEAMKRSKMKFLTKIGVARTNSQKPLLHQHNKQVQNKK